MLAISESIDCNARGTSNSGSPASPRASAPFGSSRHCRRRHFPLLAARSDWKSTTSEPFWRHRRKSCRSPISTVPASGSCAPGLPGMLSAPNLAIAFPTPARTTTSPCASRSRGRSHAGPSAIQERVALSRSRGLWWNASLGTRSLGPSGTRGRLQQGPVAHSGSTARTCANNASSPSHSAEPTVDELVATPVAQAAATAARLPPAMARAPGPRDTDATGASCRSACFFLPRLEAVCLTIR
mmetsp:Transcript_102869/g.300129  ORF Transcript_102869/g.300129 Transcript_102869/m.300129 type:complete len:241 (+) Transcript_102869:429-1151(+)